MKIRVLRCVVVLLTGAYLYSFAAATLAQSPSAGEELFLTNNQVGHYGGHLVVSLRSEPKTLNPVTSLDVSSREVIAQMTGDLVHINRLHARYRTCFGKDLAGIPRWAEVHSASASRTAFF